MARVILPNFDYYQPNDTSKLNWDEAPPAPDDYQCVLEWNDTDWDKSYGGLVWAPEIRDKLFDSFGKFGAFRTPALLDEAGFRKLCYLVAGDDHYAHGKYDRQSFVTTKRPRNYLPFKFYEFPLEWAKNMFFTRRGAPPMTWYDNNKVEDFLRKYNDVNSKRSYQNEELLEDDLFIDDAGQLVKTNDQVRIVNCSKEKLNGTIGTVYYHKPHVAPYLVRVYVPSNSGGTFIRISIQNLRKLIPSGVDLPLRPPNLPKHVVDWSKMPPERKCQVDQEAHNKVGLCDLSTDVKQHIASFLPLLDVEHNLRHACRDTFWNFRKPPPDNLEYDFVYFKVSIVDIAEDYSSHQWHEVAHTTNDVLVAIKNHDWMMEEIVITLKFVKFDRNQAIVPLVQWQCDYPLYHPVWFDPLGCHYCGVQQASDVELNRSTISLHRRETPEQREGKAHFALFRHCRNWTPREPRIQLRHMGVRMMDLYCCLFLNPEWFEDNDKFVFSAPLDSRDKSVMVFSEYRGRMSRSQRFRMEEIVRESEDNYEGEEEFDEGEYFYESENSFEDAFSRIYDPLYGGR